MLTSDRKGFKDGERPPWRYTDLGVATVMPVLSL